MDYYLRITQNNNKMTSNFKFATALHQAIKSKFTKVTMIAIELIKSDFAH